MLESLSLQSNNSNMSEIFRAKERLLSKSKSILQVDEEAEGKDRKYPRKFTLSSMSHRFDAKHNGSIHEEFSPINKQFNRMNTQKVNLNHIDYFSDIQSSRNFQKDSQKDSRITRRITAYNIQENQSPYSPIYLHKNEASYEKSETEYQEISPTKNLQKKQFHAEKINIIIAPLQKRNHNSPFKPRECLKQIAQQVIEQTKNQKRCFVDTTFPPQRTIIFNKKILYQEEGLKFQRLSRLFRHDIELIKHSEPTLLTVGKYSNPYLYSALAILCEQPSKIISLFGNQVANEEGVYYVNLCKDGVWRYIIIDDFVPIKQIVKKQMLFLYCRQKQSLIQIWPSLVEKAMAKIYGTYMDLSMVRADGIIPFFKTLTGFPVSQYSINKDFRSYLIVIDAALKKKHIVVLEGMQEENHQTAFLKNINSHQSYKIVDIKKNSILIRNLAEPELATKLSFDQALIFNRLLIFRSQNNYVYSTQKLRHKKKFFSVVHIKVASNTKCYWDIWENNPAYYKKHLGSNIEYSLSPYQIQIKQKPKGEVDPDSDLLTAEPGKQIDLKEGEYILQIHLCQAKEQDFTLSYYGEKDVELKRVKNMQLWPQSCICNIK